MGDNSCVHMAAGGSALHVCIVCAYVRVGVCVCVYVHACSVCGQLETVEMETGNEKWKTEMVKT